MTFAIVHFYGRWLKKAFLDDTSSSYCNEHKHLRFSPFKYRCARCKAL